ncbi:MAG TPA: TrmH family RNA methyltransferase [Candidatus Andersenbacteria bacterium]|nr:TrmH family RNA methyltransferase [Candidatus Andersenbacteria bacterium]
MTQKKTTQELITERPSAEELRAMPRTPLIVIADNIRSLDNVGLMFRLCELARVELFVLAGYTGYPRTEKDTRPEGIIARHDNRIQKTAVYALPHQPWQYQEDPRDFITQKKQGGYKVVALEQTTNSIPYFAATYTLPTILIVGHERLGVRQELLELADTLIEIPILGIGNSHNVAMATGIITSHILEKTGQYTKNTGKS